jgi:hypothetical protein
MDMSESSAVRSCKYVVAQRLSRWRVLRDGRDAGAFADRDGAVRFACGQARDQAEAGILGVVVVQSDVHEMHCFTPPARARAAPAAPKLRLVDGPR